MKHTRRLAFSEDGEKMTARALKPHAVTVSALENKKPVHAAACNAVIFAAALNARRAAFRFALCAARRAFLSARRSRGTGKLTARMFSALTRVLQYLPKGKSPAFFQAVLHRC